MDVKKICRNFFVGIFSSDFFRQNFFVRIFSSEFFRRNFVVRIFFVRRRSVVRPSVVRPFVRPSVRPPAVEKYLEAPLRTDARPGGTCSDGRTFVALHLCIICL